MAETTIGGMGSFALPIMTVLSGALDFASKSASVKAMVQTAQRKQQGAYYSAAQLDQNAGQQEPVGQRGMAEVERQSAVSQSRLMAMAAMNGGGTSDPTILSIRSRMMADAGYRAAQALYQGNEAARGMREQAKAQRYMGDMTVSDANNAKGAGEFAAGASLLKTGVTALSMKDRYNPKGDPQAPAPVQEGPSYNWGTSGTWYNDELPQ